MKQITRLTAKQKERMTELAQERIAIQLNTISTPETEEEAWKCIKRAYVVAGLVGPRQIVFYDSIQEFTKKMASVGASVRASVWDSVGASVRASVGASVWDSVGASVWDSVWDSVWAYDRASWHSFYAFFDEIEPNDLRHLDRFNQLVQGYCLTADTVYVMRKPAKLNRDDSGRLHSTTEHCWEDRSGFGFYALFGVIFDEKLWKKVTNKSVTFKEIVSIENTEQRMAALKLYGAEALLLQSGAKLLDTSEHGNELYEVANVFPDTEYALKFACPSTGRVYVEFVDPKIGRKGDADLAQASMWGISKEEYLSCEEET